jgi:peptidoglycan/LPS O-acetylase OafA/YrhL
MDMSPLILHGPQPGAISKEPPRPKVKPLDNAQRIPELDGLRGVAILLVLSLHYIAESRGGEFGSFLYRFKQVFRLGWSGVDLFFVLSGFLIGGILLQARNSGNYFQIFYTRRVYRIFPIYYAWLLLYILIRIVGAHWIPNSLPAAPAGIRHIPVYLLFLQNFVSMPIGTFDWYWLAVMWSLAVEEQFYLIAPILVRALSKTFLAVALCATVVLAPVLRELIYRLTPRGDEYWYTLMPCRADALAIGMLAALAWKTEEIRTFLFARKRSVYQALVFFLCGIPILLKYFPGPSYHLTATLGFSWLAFFYVTLLLVVLTDADGKLGRAMRLRWLRRIGSVSYCIYLIHFPLNGLLHAILLRSRPNIATLSGVSVTFLAAALTYAIAALSWKCFEGPIVRRGHRHQYSPRTSCAMETRPVPAGVGAAQAGVGGGVENC